MSQLHQILPVETDLSGRAKEILAEASATFTKRTEHFGGSVRTLSMNDDARSNENATEVKALETTVSAKLDYVQGKIAPFYDALLQKEAANQEARADLEVDGVVLAKNVPATALLAFESRLKELREVYRSIPTLAPGIEWVKDEQTPNVWRNKNSKKTMKTEKTLAFKEISPATKEHKAQVETWHADVPVGVYIETQQSGALSPGEKSKLLERVDHLITAVKQARQRANMVEVPNVRIGEAIFSYIHG